MHQTKKGNQWYFGMKAHVETRRCCLNCCTGPGLWGDPAYRGQTEVIKKCAPQAQDHTRRRYRYKNSVDEEERAKNRTKSSVRSKVRAIDRSANPPVVGM